MLPNEEALKVAKQQVLQGKRKASQENLEIPNKKLKNNKLESTTNILSDTTNMEIDNACKENIS